ncbi:TetR/AcrR family transcriptional regulator [Oceanirhabdus sp. W0125-5]|uniref:TetR/AcrR family transcriptional regulator n=1 Tax=Oceanirhabdus sp. W0125-5 TaxID=2999116 RepID=UPI0022F2D502|nr:TetR/AcrR family transcriptional regulator [Oceanirhabdus sp. W0125-5]WBW95639.1 TetR/AcrR family transcriptional regulator [Oceanirhabdus sp. W0125-5]
MEEIFKNMDPEKRDRIINSALEEFSTNRFEKASTNNIVKNAGISKGLLYHYFSSKRILYEYLETFVIEIITDAISKEMNWEEKDLFARLKQIVLIKLKVYVRYPYLVAFGKVMFEKKSIDELKKEAENYIPDVYKKVYYENIDFTLFKDNVDVQKAIKITQWSLEKLGEEWMKSSALASGDTDYSGLSQEIDEYLEILKRAFYK